ncbi:hypothetical protein [Actinomadura sp. K4S16]|uniref:hypothetical protein n=1 Tax=Actinomadura sp. K4S16 TaxID=1316147 RepID=UPI0011EDE276|nr:hypothetical protein [Actinomadura sp. K4S16]
MFDPVFAFVIALAVGVVLAVGFVLGRVTSRRPGPVGERLADSITSFGEELDVLSFDPSGPQATPEALEDYRFALDAYDRAKTAASAPDALSALKEGRAALIRLEARRNGRPVPIDALERRAPARRPSRAEPSTGERFVATGRGNGTTEVLIDRPEPGRPAIADLVFSGKGNLLVAGHVRTEARIETLDEPQVIWIDDYRGRVFLPVECTHLKVRVENGHSSTWTARFLSIDHAAVLERELQGDCAEVVTYKGPPGKVTVQVRAERSWELKAVNERNGDYAARDYYAGVSDVGDSMLKMEVRPGDLLVMTMDGPGFWSLHAGD